MNVAIEELEEIKKRIEYVEKFLKRGKLQIEFFLTEFIEYDNI